LLSRGSLGFTGFATITHPYDQRVVPGKVPGAQCYEPNDPISSRSKVPIVAVHSESKSTVAHSMLRRDGVGYRSLRGEPPL